MGFLNPLFLLAGLAVAVPLILHLVHRPDSRRVIFPALRYLQRTERQHARQIRLRQLLLLLLRVATVLLVVAAGARLFLRGRGSLHDPTAVVVVLDNSMSSGLVHGGRRVFDELKELALATIDEATPEDRIWVVRAADPTDLVAPATPETARRRIVETGVSHGPGDLDAAVQRALSIAADSELDAREVHVLSDLQASAFDERSPERTVRDVPVLVYRPDHDPPPNRYLSRVLVGGGLPPVAGQRTEVAASVAGDPGEEGDTVWVRLVVDRRVRAAAPTPSGATALLAAGPYPPGLLSGYVETDPDSLAADDRRYFALTVQRAPGVALEGGEAFFVDQALRTLELGGRIRRVGVAEAEVLVAVSGAGLERRGQDVPTLVVPSGDPALLPSLNRRLTAAGIPWRYGAPTSGGEAPLQGDALGVDLRGVRVTTHYALEPVEAPEATDLLARLPSGDPWLISGQSAGGPYLLVASPLDDTATTLPVSAAMLPLLEHLLTRSALGGAADADVEAGSPFPTPPNATVVRTPDGTLTPVDGTHVFRSTRQAGIYEVLAEDTVLDRVAVNVPPRESLLDRLDTDALRARYGSDITLARDSAAWSRAVFTSRQGLEIWQALLFAALVLLLAESWFAAAGPARPGRSGAPTRESP